MSEVRRKPRRRLVILLVICSILLLGWLVAWILLRPDVVASFITGRISKLLGGEVSFEDARWLDSGRLEIRGFQLHAPGLDGQEGLIAKVDSLVFQLALGGVLRGEVVHGVEIDGALLRLAENRSLPWRYNIDHLEPATGSSGGGNLPAILVSGLRVETGTYDPSEPDRWELIGRANFSGEAEEAGDGGAYLIELTELTAETDHPPIQLHGEFNPEQDRIELSITGVSFDEEIRALMPARDVRRAWEEFDLRGSLELVEAVFEAGQSPEISLALKDVNLVLPLSLGSESQWVHYHQGQIRTISGKPRLHVYNGMIRFSGESLRLDHLDGYVVGESIGDELSPVPCVINLEISHIPDLETIGQEDDLASFLDRAPFDLQLQTQAFQFEQGGSADLPEQAAEIFVLFGVQSCSVDIDLHFWRDASPGPEMPVAPVQFLGKMTIADAAGAFEGFPYPLHELKAMINFDQEMIHLEDLVANGSGASKVTMHGEVSATPQPSVAINLAATNLPLDGALIDAMPPEASSMMRSLFGRHGAMATADAGDRSPAHEHVGLALQINRTAGADQDTTLSGLITFDHLNITWEGFPYPIRLWKGRLDWHADEMEIENIAGDGPVMITTSGNGDGVLQGTILLPDEDRAASGDLELAVKGDSIGPLLLDAMRELSPAEGELLTELGLSGKMDYAGRITVHPGGELAYDLVLKLEGGQVQPTDAFAGVLGLPGPIWPIGFQLRDVNAALLATPDRIEIESLRGRNDLTNLELEGEIQVNPEPDLDLSLVLDGLPLSERIIVMFPENERETLLEVWERWDSQGYTSLLVNMDSPGAEGLTGTIHDLWLESSDGHTCQLASGSVSLDSREVTLDGIRLDFNEPGSDVIDDWSLNVEGLLERGGYGRDTVIMHADRARFGSPFLSPVAAALMPEAAGRTWRDLEVDGWFSGRLDLDTDLEPSWRLHLEPAEVAMTHHGERIRAEFESAQVDLDGSGSATGAVVGESNFGWFDVTASAQMGEVGHVGITFDFDGHLGHPAARAILPPVIGNSLGELNWSDGLGTRIQDGELAIQLDEDGTPASIRTRGDMTIHGAAMNLGVEISEIEASLTGWYEETAVGAANLDVQFEVSRLEAADRPVLEATGSMALSEDGHWLEVSGVRGTISDGAISVEARLALDGDDPERPTQLDDWSVELLIANADLLRLFGGETDDIVIEEEESELDDLDEGEAAEVEGRVYMSMYLGGQFEDPATRRGLGQVRILDAVLGNVPVIVGIQQILQLTIPTLTRPDFVEIKYHVDGLRIILDSILIESSLGDISPFGMTGSGSYDWARGEINAYLFPRGGLRFVDDIISLVQDKIYAVGVSGPIRDPEVELVPFPGLR